MLRLDFLSAADGTPLTKTFTPTEVMPYPNVGRFNSLTTESATLADAYQVILEQAARGNCLLKGHTSRILEAESRAGSTMPNTPTDWLCLDLDFHDGYGSIDEFLEDLYPGASQVSYIFQHSSSAGIKHAAGLRGHVFMRLAAPVLPSVLKQWLKDANFRMAPLQKRLELNASGLALKFPLDISTCQNDKLLYIAPPNCIDIPDPIAGQRFQFHARAAEALTFSPKFNPAKIQQETQDCIDNLREEQGLKKRKAKLKVHKHHELLLNPDHAVVTGIKQARGYTYLNLNGGDSWAYYFPDDNPELLHNFKGEPAVQLKDIAPDFYAQLKGADEEQKKIQPIVFRDPISDSYWNGIYDRGADTLQLYQCGSKQKLADFMRQYEMPPPDVVEDWTLEFNPTVNHVIDIKKKWANRFTPTPYMTDTTTPKTTLVPRTIHKIIASVCGGDTVTLNYFLNWLAFVFQTRKKALTGWMFHGVPGTGKGLMYERILKPLFGPQYVVQLTSQNFEEQFNANLETALIVWLDEFSVDSMGQKLIDKIKNALTEETMIVRAMRQNARTAPSYSNFMIASNHETIMPLDPVDRRWNVAPAQETRIDITPDELDSISAELPYFASFLKHHQVDERQVRYVLQNDARNAMIQASENSVDRFFRAIREGDLEYFVDYLRTKPPISPDNAYIDFEKAVENWASNLGTTMAVPRDDFIAAYTYLQNKQTTPTKFSRMLSLHRLKVTPQRIGPNVVRAITVTWKASDHDAILARVQSKKPKLADVKPLHQEAY